MRGGAWRAVISGLAGSIGVRGHAGQYTGHCGPANPWGWPPFFWGGRVLVGGVLRMARTLVWMPFKWVYLNVTETAYFQAVRRVASQPSTPKRSLVTGTLPCLVSDQLC